MTQIYVFLSMNRPRKILILQTAFLGDAILMTALLEQIHAEDPEAQVQVLVRKGFEGLIRTYPGQHLVQVWAYDKTNKWASWWKLRREFSKQGFDEVLVLQRFTGMALLALSIGAKKVRGFKESPFSCLFDHRIGHQMGDGRHEIDRNAALLGKELPVRCFPSLNPPKSSLPFDLTEKSFVILSPGSVWETKRLPIAQWVAFLKALPAEEKVLLMGSPNEAHLADEILAQGPYAARVLNGVAAYDLVQSLGIYAQAKWVICQDSAPLHLASALKLPSLSVFCSTVPAFGFGPLQAPFRIVENQQALPCRPCGLHGKKACPLGHFDCAKGISLEQLLDAYQELSSGSQQV